MPGSRRWMYLVGGVVAQLLLLVVVVIAWGDWRRFFASPARVGFMVACLGFAVATLFSDISFGAGRREDRRGRSVFIPAAVGTLLLVWLVPYQDGRDILVLDGDAARYTGLVLFVVGGILRVWPVFTLGKRFSPFVAIQADHQLVTEGPYRIIRHPSYLGALVVFAGWALVFRSIIGLVALVPTLGFIIRRINLEESLLESEFGAQYAAYRQRSWRLIPFVY